MSSSVSVLPSTTASINGKISGSGSNSNSNSPAGSASGGGAPSNSAAAAAVAAASAASQALISSTSGGSSSSSPSSSAGSGNGHQVVAAPTASATTSNSPSAGGGGKNMSSDASAPANPLASFKLLLLIMMVLQNSSTVLVGRYTRSSVEKESLYEVNHLILIIEVCKLLLACALEFYTTGGDLLGSFRRHVVDRPTDVLKMLVPALLYLVQNTLLYVALSNLTAPIFQVTYQAKLVTTALVSVVMLQRSYAPQQWVCLTALSLGVAIVVLGEKGGSKPDDTAKEMHQNLFIGLTSVSIACLSSALAGVYFEKVLKKPAVHNTDDAQKVAPASLWMRNMQLAFFSVVIAYFQGGRASSSPDAAAGDKPYLHGFTAWVWVLVALQAGGGMLVAAVIKYADNVLKGLATGVSVVVATAFSMLLFGTPLTTQFTFGAVLILTSVWFFSNPMPPMSVLAAKYLPASLSNKSSSPKHETEAIHLPR